MEDTKLAVCKTHLEGGNCESSRSWDMSHARKICFLRHKTSILRTGYGKSAIREILFLAPANLY